MTRVILAYLISLISISNAFSQMNFQDSSVQVITYWNLGDKYEYSVNFQKLKYSEIDTTSHETMTYDVDVTVIDSTTNGYTVRWLYKDFKTDSENPLVQKILSVSEDIAVDINLDEMGSILGVANWEEVRDYMAIAFDTLSAELPDILELKNMVNTLKAMYSTKESIEGSAIQDAQQFHNFYGSKFTLNKELTGQTSTQNIYFPDKPFDTQLSVVLEKLDQENNQYRIRSISEVDSKQLTETTYLYLTELFKELNQVIPPRDEFEDLTNIKETVSTIHNTGWVLESVLWTEVFTDGLTNMEVRRIEMK